MLPGEVTELIQPFEDTLCMRRGMIEGEPSYAIGGTRVPNDAIMFTTKHSFAIKCETPCAPNHHLVFPKRIIGDSAELPAEEFVDLHRACYAIGDALKTESAGDDGILIFANDIVDAGKQLTHTYYNVMSTKSGVTPGSDSFYDLTELKSMAPPASFL